jgi:hypothetical protein
VDASLRPVGHHAPHYTICLRRGQASATHFAPRELTHNTYDLRRGRGCGGRGVRAPLAAGGESQTDLRSLAP